MLVLSRKRGDAVAVGEPDNCRRAVKVTVLEIRSTQVKLGFEAPSDIPVHRWEVWERINGPNGDPMRRVTEEKNSEDQSSDAGGL